MTNEGKKAEDKGKEEDVEEISKAGETKEGTNKGQKAEDKDKEEDVLEVMNEGKTAEDMGKEEEVEEISKAGEGWDRNVIISDEKARGGGRAEKEWCRAPIEEGRNQRGRGRIRGAEYPPGCEANRYSGQLHW